MYVALPVGTAADKWREDKKKQTGKARSIAQLRLAHMHAHTHTLYEEVNARASENECFMNTFENSFFFVFLLGPVSSIIDLGCTETFTCTDTHITLQYFCLLIPCRLIPQWHFLWSAIYVSFQTGLPSLLLLSRLLCVSVFLYMHSQWNNGSFQLRRTDFVRF